MRDALYISMACQVLCVFWNGFWWLLALVCPHVPMASACCVAYSTAGALQIPSFGLYKLWTGVLQPMLGSR